MKLLLANPNATEAVTKACADLARAAASPGTEIVAWTNRGGPPVVEDRKSTRLNSSHRL